ncbi:hypothetical protein PTKIN_Ptkin05aG0001500 [Pterospermum kingtungense]
MYVEVEYKLASLSSGEINYSFSSSLTLLNLDATAHCHHHPCFLFYPPRPRLSRTMKPPSPSPSPLNFLPNPIPFLHFYNSSFKSPPHFNWVSKLEPQAAKFPLTRTSAPQTPLQLPLAAPNSQLETGIFQGSGPGSGSGSGSGSPDKLEAIEEDVEKAIYRCRFLTLLAVFGSLTGSFLCFIKGCTYIISSFVEYFVNHGKVIFLLVEAIDIYLLGTVMLVFGTGLYELFVCNLDIAKLQSKEKATTTSNLFGLFALKERPRWLEIKSVSELKTKLGHVIVMLLLIGFFEKCKKAAIHSPLDLLCFSASVLLSSGCLFLLSKLNDYT